MTYQECVDYIMSVPLFGKKLGTDNLNQILELMGHPEQCCPVVHVAGTNGKGSTCSFLASILTETGCRVGLFTSPHLVKINERIRINGEVISDEEFMEVFQEVMGYMETAKRQGIPHPSFFELLFLMSALYFKKQGVDFMIFETGMGGRLDATNVVKPALCIITSVGLDHMQYLGNTVEEIAREKAGIIKPGVPVVFFDRKGPETKIITDFCKNMGANCHAVRDFQYKILKIKKKTIDFSFNSGYYEYSGLQIRRTALYQLDNAALAVKAFEILLSSCRDCFGQAGMDFANNGLTDRYLDIVKAGLVNMVWPCRMECVANHIYIDGAHNEEAIEAFCKTLEVLFPEEQKILLFAVSKDKDYEAMIKRLCRIPFQEIIIVRYDGDRSAGTADVEEAFRHFSGSKITTFDDIEAGFAYGKSHVDEQYLFCVGSLYLAGNLLGLGV